MPTSMFNYDALGRLTCATVGDPVSGCDPASPDLRAHYTYDHLGNRTHSFFRDPSGATHAHTFSRDTANGFDMRIRSWKRDEWSDAERMNLAYGSSSSGLGGPGHRVAESRVASGADPGVQRYWNYYASGRAATVSVFDSRGSMAGWYGYDHLGRRRINYESYSDGSSRYEVHFYDVAGRAIGTLTSAVAGGVAVTLAEPFYWVDEEPVYRLRLTNGGSGWTVNEQNYLYSDHTGTPRVMMRTPFSWEGGASTVAYRATNEPFMAGPPATSSGSAPLRMRAPGQWADLGTEIQGGAGALSAPMSALVANHARVYDPGMGAYGQREPMLARGRVAGVEGVSPWFGYAGHRPTEFVDPDGRWVGWAVAAIAVVGVLAADALYLHEILQTPPDDNFDRGVLPFLDEAFNSPGVSRPPGSQPNWWQQGFSAEQGDAALTALIRRRSNSTDPRYSSPQCAAADHYLESWNNTRHPMLGSMDGVIPLLMARQYYGAKEEGRDVRTSSVPASPHDPRVPRWGLRGISAALGRGTNSASWESGL
jgi:hypothetical protein